MGTCQHDTYTNRHGAQLHVRHQDESETNTLRVIISCRPVKITNVFI